MRYIDTSFAIDPTTQQPFTTKSLDFLQIGTVELVNAICNNLIYVKGLTPTSGVPYLIDSAIAGGSKAILFNGKIYITVATLTGYAHIDTTPDATADPLLFTDLVNRNVHNDNYLIFNATAAGAIFNAAAIVDVTIGLKTPSKPVISTYTTLTNVTTVSNVPLTLLFPTELSDLDNQFTSGIFTPKQTGFHQMSVNVVMAIGAATTETLSLLFQKNGANTNRCYYTLGNYLGNGNYVEATLTTIFNVTSITDTYTVKLLTIANQTVSVDGNINYNFISQ